MTAIRFALVLVAGCVGLGGTGAWGDEISAEAYAKLQAAAPLAVLIKVVEVKNTLYGPTGSSEEITDATTHSLVRARVLAVTRGADVSPGDTLYISYDHRIFQKPRPIPALEEGQSCLAYLQPLAPGKAILTPAAGNRSFENITPESRPK